MPDNIRFSNPDTMQKPPGYSHRGRAASAHVEAEGLGGLEIDHQLVLGRVLHRQISRFLALEDAVDVAGRVPQTRGYRYAVANDRVLLVGTSRIVVGVFADANARRAKHAGFTMSA